MVEKMPERISNRSHDMRISGVMASLSVVKEVRERVIDAMLPSSTALIPKSFPEMKLLSVKPRSLWHYRVRGAPEVLPPGMGCQV